MPDERQTSTAEGIAPAPESAQGREAERRRRRDESTLDAVRVDERRTRLRVIRRGGEERRGLAGDLEPPAAVPAQDAGRARPSREGGEERLGPDVLMGVDTHPSANYTKLIGNVVFLSPRCPIRSSTMSVASSSAPWMKLDLRRRRKFSPIR